MVAKKKKDPNFLKNLKEGTLHKALGYGPDEKIPDSKINAIVNKEVGDIYTTKSGEKKKVTAAIKKKANFAKNAKKFKH